jgi:Domain of unknown function (DUF362)
MISPRGIPLKRNGHVVEALGVSRGMDKQDQAVAEAGAKQRRDLRLAMTWSLRAGLADVVRQEGASFFGHNRTPFTAVALEYKPEADVHGPQASVMVNPRVLEYDTLIALNQLTVHQTATVTLALKNIAMSYLAADYYSHPRLTQHHRHWFFDDMHSFIAAMARRFPIHLAVTAHLYT